MTTDIILAHCHLGSNPSPLLRRRLHQILYAKNREGPVSAFSYRFYFLPNATMIKRLKWNVLYAEDGDVVSSGSDSDDSDDSVRIGTKFSDATLRKLQENDPDLAAALQTNANASSDDGNSDSESESHSEDPELDGNRWDDDQDFVEWRECALCPGKRLLRDEDVERHIASKQHQLAVKRVEGNEERTNLDRAVDADTAAVPAADSDDGDIDSDDKEGLDVDSDDDASHAQLHQRAKANNSKKRRASRGGVQTPAAKTLAAMAGDTASPLTSGHGKKVNVGQPSPGKSKNAEKSKNLVKGSDSIAVDNPSQAKGSTDVSTPATPASAKKARAKRKLQAMKMRKWQRDHGKTNGEALNGEVDRSDSKSIPASNASAAVKMSAAAKIKKKQSDSTIPSDSLANGTPSKAEAVSVNGTKPVAFVNGGAKLKKKKKKKKADGKRNLQALNEENGKVAKDEQGEQAQDLEGDVQLDPNPIAASNVSNGAAPIKKEENGALVLDNSVKRKKKKDKKRSKESKSEVGITEGQANGGKSGTISPPGNAADFSQPTPKEKRKEKKKGNEKLVCEDEEPKTKQNVKIESTISFKEELESKRSIEKVKTKKKRKSPKKEEVGIDAHVNDNTLDSSKEISNKLNGYDVSIQNSRLSQADEEAVATPQTSGKKKKKRKRLETATGERPNGDVNGILSSPKASKKKSKKMKSM